MAIESAPSASNLQLDYMNLLVTQLQNQNPLEPMSNEDMTAQLAQFSQLQQLETLNQSFDQVLENSQRGLANNMLGKQVSFVDMDSFNADNTQGVTRTGQVLKMEMIGDMEMLTVAEVDQETLEIREYDVWAEKVITTELDEFSQFKEFDQLASLNNRFNVLLKDSQRSFANSTVGKQVSFIDKDSLDEDGNPIVRTGQVTKLDLFGGTEILRIEDGENNYSINASEITSIHNF